MVVRGWRLELKTQFVPYGSEALCIHVMTIKHDMEHLN